MTPEQVAVAEAPVRLAERQSIVAFIRKRAAWLNALADDIDAQKHDDED